MAKGDLTAALRRMASMGRMEVKVGVTSQEIHPGSNVTAAELMAIHEYGAPSAGVPARRPLARTARARRDEIRAMFARAASRVAAGESGELEELGRIGEGLAEAVRRKIDEGLPPPLKDATIARKVAHGSPTPTTPLADSGWLKERIGFVVTKK